MIQRCLLLQQECSNFKLTCAGMAEVGQHIDVWWNWWTHRRWKSDFFVSADYRGDTRNHELVHVGGLTDDHDHQHHH